MGNWLQTTYAVTLLEELVTNYLCGNPVRGNAAILRRGEASGRAFNIIQLETLWFEQREKCLFSEELLI
jgi:hypothetical protein